MEVDMSRWSSALLVAVFALVAAHAQPLSPAQGPFVITGTVVDDQLQPVAGAALTLERAGTVVGRAVSDRDGAYRLTAVRAGEYAVRVSAAGFSDTTRRLTMRSTMARIQLPLVLTKPGRTTAPEPMPALAAATTPTGATFSRDILANIPSARDPWQIINTQSASAIGGGSASGTQISGAGRGGGAPIPVMESRGNWNLDAQPSGDTYTPIDRNRFQRTINHPLSTFGADVDTASYANVRRFLGSGQLPPSDAVRVEELINYFRFDYAAPKKGRPISLTTEIGDCPWAPSHRLVLVGARAAVPAPREITGRNLVLLIDVSGSMQPADRLPLLKTALGLFADTLTSDDTVAIVTYAGTSGVVLPPTGAHNRERIQQAIAGLGAGGSTNGAAGVITAYRTAREAFIPGGVNRVILATDGDFNVGLTGRRDLLRLIERERDSGVFLSVFGVGRGNLRDGTMEMLADHGNGNYAYLDSLQEARRVLIREGQATLEAVAKDVKFQVEFNPAVVASWRLVGYEDRRLAARDFNDDRKDAGEMGAGHTVTALYEVIPAADTAGEWLTVKARYKAPDADESDLIVETARRGGRTRFLPLASAVAEFGLVLRDAPRDIARWDALLHRLDALDAPETLAVEIAELRELAATARGLARLR